MNLEISQGIHYWQSYITGRAILQAELYFRQSYTTGSSQVVGSGDE